MKIQRNVKMKTSNKFLAGAGIFLAALILSMVIGARVVFDQEILPNLDKGIVTYLQNR